jgi:hypothetical protein
MSLITAFLDVVGSWFGFVGSCVVSPIGACVPFLAFLAAGVGAGAALALLLLAYRSARRDAQGNMRSAAGQDSATTIREPAHLRMDQSPVTA